MEEKEIKKRRGYATKEGQNEANKRYRATEKGKEIQKKAVSKSHTKKFIKEMATLDELRELKELIQNKIDEL